MADAFQQVSPQQEVPPTPQFYAPLPAQPQKTKKTIWIIIGIAIAVIGLCSIVCVAVLGTTISKVLTEKTPVELVLDTYMRHMLNKDAESAYALFSPRAQRQIPISKVQEMLEGNNFFLFEGYQSLSVSTLNIGTLVNTDPNIPQGTVAKVTGVLNFDGNIQGTFNGTLEKVGDEWMLDGIYITVPTNKIP